MLREKTAILKKFIESDSNDDQKIKKDKRENILTFENTKLAIENVQLAEKFK